MIEDFTYNLFFADESEIAWWSMGLRGLIIYFCTMVYIKISGKRMFSKYAAIDIILSITFGAILAKVIVGSAKFFPALFTLFIMTLIHRLLGIITASENRIGNLFKGKPILLARNGEMFSKEMKQHNITKDDILEAMRMEAKVDDISKAKEIYLERNGKISFVLKSKE